MGLHNFKGLHPWRYKRWGLHPWRLACAISQYSFQPLTQTQTHREAVLATEVPSRQSHNQIFKPQRAQRTRRGKEEARKLKSEEVRRKGILQLPVGHFAAFSTGEARKYSDTDHRHTAKRF